MTVTHLADNLTEAEAFTLERFFIAAVGRRDLCTGPLCNMTSGGDGAPEPSECQRRAISNRMQALHANPKFRKQALAGLEKARLDPEIQARRSQRIKAAFRDPAFRAKKRKSAKLLANQPSVKAMKAAQMRDRWRDEGFRERQRALASKTLKETHKNAIHKARWKSIHSKRMKALHSDPTEHAEMVEKASRARWKPVVMLTESGVVLRAFQSIKEAAIELGCDSSNIAKACKGVRKTYIGHKWAYQEVLSDLTELRKHVANKRQWRTKPVVMLSKDGEVLQQFNSIKEAASATGVCRDGISKACNEKLKTCGGFKWVFRSI